MFAQLSETDPDPLLVVDHRKVFFKPSVIQVLNTEFSTTARYDMVVVVTGLRNNPLNLGVVDRVYSLREFHVDELTDLDEDGEPDAGTYTTIQGETAAVAGTLFDATDVVVIDPEEGAGGDLEDLQVSDGWYIELRASGEKALADPLVLAGALTFTTYLPEGVVDTSSCSLAEGSGLLYGVNVLTGGVVFNFDDADGTQELTLSDKTLTLGAGIPSGVVSIFHKQGELTYLAGTGSGGETFDPDKEVPRGRSFWYEQ